MGLGVVLGTTVAADIVELGNKTSIYCRDVGDDAIVGVPVLGIWSENEAGIE